MNTLTAPPVRVLLPDVPAPATFAATLPGMWNAEFRVLLLACWMLWPTCLSLPGRGGPLDLEAFDSVAIAKTLLRGGAFALAGLLLLRINASPRTFPVLARLGPLAMFAAWCTVSVTWSALKTVSAGHAMELVTMLLLAICAGILVDSEERQKTMLFHFFMALFSITLLVTLLGLPAILSGERPTGYLHPNALGAISATALFLLLACRFLWNWTWSRRMFIPGAAVCCIAMFVARSRSSFLVLIVLAVLFWTRRRRSLLIGTLLAAGVLLASAPYLKSVSDLPDAVQSYVLRGQTAEDLKGASGRDELWALALDSFRESPLLGHGYYMLSASGSMYVWQKQQYQTAHNLGLHVLTGTGTIGALLFVWGFWSALAPMVQGRKQELVFLTLLLASWVFLVGLFELSILGPVDPTIVAFFGIAGAAAGPGIQTARAV